MFYGRGAGKFPTASAVLGDMIEEVQLDHTIPAQTWENVNSTDFIEDFAAFRAKRYIRSTSADAAVLNAAFGDIAVSKTTADGETVCITENEMNAAEVEAAVQKLAADGVKVLAQYPVLVS